MPAPRIFVSSTCYDLKYIRENLKFFIRGLGYEPVLSEEGAVYYDPTLHVQDACLVEVPACQMFVLIIGGRYGGQYKDSGRSITNAEYLEAARTRIPIFAFMSGKKELARRKASLRQHPASGLAWEEVEQRVRSRHGRQFHRCAGGRAKTPQKRTPGTKVDESAWEKNF